MPRRGRYETSARYSRSGSGWATAVQDIQPTLFSQRSLDNQQLSWAPIRLAWEKRLQLGVVLNGRCSAEEIAELAHLAEEQGFEHSVPWIWNLCARRTR